ncbi:hypothetical protein N7462_006870 [Penicillium macrosclerotiorum]|uniref:uncharacterized protein n=1 Tax=Penicillium macrosclerotiorum TaxID=303699 RepID=UPI002546C5E0|nr:uncharacterized protein N7462_006870 [Penicillium macrosclerotiorum]KAJ5678626.1 hypothetical protein N7462_006870 [Penicillium macrosclerotiorum]
MPRWGRPPGARPGRYRGGRAQWEEEARVEEVESEEDDDDVFGRELVRNGRGGYMRQLEYGGRGPRRRPVEYQDWTDETESVEGGDFDLYDHDDRTVAYAVQLAMRDKEDQLVEKALERIRRAQMLGKKNVRLSQRELDALERKRQQTDNPSGNKRSQPAGNTANSRPTSSRRSGAPEPQPGPYPSFAAEAGWGAPHGRPTSSSSARPRTPTMQSLRPQQSNSPLRPAYPPFSDRPSSNGRPQSMQQPIYSRPLPDDPHWAPPYYNPMQMSPYGTEQPPYQPGLPTDLRVGPQSRMSYPLEMSPIQAQHRMSLDGRTSMAASKPRGARPGTEIESEELSSEGEEETESSEDEIQIVQAKERQGPPGLQRRAVSGGSRGGRSRKSR